MISNEQIALNVLRVYIQHIHGLFPPGVYLAERYLFILQIREWQLKRMMLKKVPTLENLQTLKTGHRSAEQFLFDIDGGGRKDVIAEIEDILQLIALEFHKEIGQIEAQHPELRAEFAREREEYRLGWNNYVREAERH